MFFVLWNLILLSKVWQKYKLSFVLGYQMQGDLFIPKLWMKMTTWSKVQLVRMEIMKSKPNQVLYIIEHVK